MIEEEAAAHALAPQIEGRIVIVDDKVTDSLVLTNMQQLSNLFEQLMHVSTNFFINRHILSAKLLNVI